GNLPPTDSGKTRDKAAETVGMSGRTYEKAKAVVEAAEKDPTLKPVVEEMDRTGKVDPAYRKVVKPTEAEKQERRVQEKRRERRRRAHEKLKTAPGEITKWENMTADEVMELWLENARLRQQNERLKKAQTREGLQDLMDGIKGASIPADVRKEVMVVIERWFRGLVKKHHADRSGSDEVMAALIDARNQLVALLGKKGGDA